jgi:hypothetical protein
MKYEALYYFEILPKLRKNVSFFRVIEKRSDKPASDRELTCRKVTSIY